MKTPYFLPDKIYDGGNYTQFEELIDAKGNEVSRVERGLS